MFFQQNLSYSYLKLNRKICLFGYHYIYVSYDVRKRWHELSFDVDTEIKLQTTLFAFFGTADATIGRIDLIACDSNIVLRLFFVRLFSCFVVVSFAIFGVDRSRHWLCCNWDPKCECHLHHTSCRWSWCYFSTFGQYLILASRYLIGFSSRTHIPSLKNLTHSIYVSVAPATSTAITYRVSAAVSHFTPPFIIILSFLVGLVLL
jgi:hypothetical protein